MCISDQEEVRYRRKSTKLSDMLHDSSVAKVYLMGDALGECTSDLSHPLLPIASNIRTI